MRLVLASASPRRSRLLASAGYSFEVDPADVDETPLPEEGPLDLVVRLAAEKALAVAVRHPSAVVLGADTVVVYDGRILGKPVDDADAETMLRAMSGRSHQAVTGWAVVWDGSVTAAASVTDVWFRTLTSEEIAEYVASGEPADKAGAYAIQGGAAGFVQRYDGSFRNVVGLPVDAIAPTLDRHGVIPSGPISWQSEGAPADWKGHA